MEADPGSECRLGVLAFGDSITNGGGELQHGVALQSWALWVARGLGLPFTGHAVDGARIGGVLGEQIPGFERLSARPTARYDLGCLYIGVNDVRAPQWSEAEFERGLARALAFLASRCERTLTLTAPLDLGRPRAGPRVAALNAAIVRAATGTGTLVADLGDLRARNWVMADRVHPTAFGQIAIAERALRVLARDGAQVKVEPASLIAYETTRWRRLRGDVTYVYRSVREGVRAGIGGGPSWFA
ncbi:MAG: GDSL-type esterase/lipase family protein [Thermoleophilaceae bacterium]